MQNIKIHTKSRFFNLRHAFVLSLLIAFGGLLMYSFTGCSSGPSDSQPGIGTETTTIYGRVVDESGAPMPGVSVSAGVQSALTDVNGLYILKNATVPKGRAIVLAKKSGYFNAAHAEAPNSNGTTRIELSMMTDAVTATVPSATGGLVNIAAGGSISFSGGSFTDATGAAYTGQVKVSARYLDPKNSNFFDFFSGDDMAQMANGKSMSLISSGVLRVELKDASGNSLKLDASKPAMLSFPKPLDTKAPLVMPLWYFDESLGMWKEEGNATLKNGVYTGTVTHFTDWNLDYKDSTGDGYSSATVSLRVVCNGIPIGDVAVSIVGDDAPGKYFVHPGGKTGPDGTITFLRFPDNRPTQIDINSAKNNGLYFINTPINVTVSNGQNLNLGDISLNSPCPASIQGSLTGCDGSKAEGLVTISDGKNLTYVYTKTGDFIVQAASGIPLTVDAMDVNGNQAATVSVPMLNAGEQRNIGNIKICGTGAANYLDITIPAVFGGIKQEGQYVTLSPDGTRLALWSVSNIGVFDTKTGNMICSGTVAGTSNVNLMQFSMDNSKLLVSSNYGGGAILLDVSGATPTQLQTIPNVAGAKLSDDGTQIIALLSKGYNVAPDVNIYKASDGSIMQTVNPTGMTDSVMAFGFDRDENAIVYPDIKTNGLAHVWSIPGNAELRNFPIAGGSYSFLSSEDGLTVASSADYKTYSFYDTKTGQKTGNDVNTAGANSTRYGNLILTKNNAYIADQVDSANVIRVFKIADGTSTIKIFSGSNYVASVTASRNEKNLAAVSNGILRIWTLQ